MEQFIPLDIATIIVIVGIITIIYTLLGGMEAVIWTDVMQSAIMIVGVLFCAVYLTMQTFSQPDYLIQHAFDNNKFSFGDWDFSLANRTVWVMIVYGVTENIRNLIADQNYVQKYVSVGNENDAKRSVWIAMLIYIPLTAVFLYIGTNLFAYYSAEVNALPEGVVKGDQIFPHFIVTVVPVGLRGLIIAAIVAAAMSTVDSTLNCSATISLIDFKKRFWDPDIDEQRGVVFLRTMTVIWGIIGTAIAVLMINIKSALDVWWEFAGIFGGGMLGLFLLALFRVRLRMWHGLVAIAASLAVIIWGTFIGMLEKFLGYVPESLKWMEAWQIPIDPILVGAGGTAVMLFLALLFGLTGKSEEPKEA